MHQIQNRHIGVSRAQVIDEWTTNQITITTVQPKDTQPLNNTTTTNLGFGVEIQPHPVRASVRLSTMPQATRDLGSHPLAERKFSPAIPALVDLLNKSYEKKEQNIATEALVQIGDNSTLPYLIRALGDRSKTNFQETLFSAIKQFSLSEITQATLDCLNSNRKISWRGAA